MTKLEHALSLAAKGFRVFPIAPNQKKPPLLTGWPKRATSDADEVRQFWAAVPDANIGIHCDGFVVLDVDVAKDGNDSLTFLEITHGLPSTLTTITASGGRHLFYRLPDQHQGVPNSVGVLGSGLDIRSAGGYVLGPGSQVDAGAYGFELDSVAIAQAPQWLLDRLGQAPARTEPAQPVPDAPESAVDRARTWLAGQAPAVEGQGGDAHTFKVACGLRDMGVSEDQAVELMAVWNEKCSPPWMSNILGVKVRNAYYYGQNEPGARAALPQDFSIVEERQNVGTSSELPTVSHKAQRLSDFAAREAKGPGYVVKGLLERRSYAELFGAPGEGKTFVALDIAYNVAAGTPWMERKIHAGTVLYLAYEGTGGLVKRTQALRQRYGKKDVPLYVAGAAFNLRDLKGRQELGALLAALPEKPVLIVIDTFARALMGGDENSAQDVGAFNAAVAGLIESTGGCVLIVHHSGKNKAAGARGSSALQGAIDTELEIDSSQIISRKQRDVEISAPIGFQLVPLIVGIDSDGDDVTSCVVEMANVAVPVERLTGNAKRGFEALCSISEDNTPTTTQAWHEVCKEFLGGTRTRQGFYDIKKKLLRAGVIVEDAQGLIIRRFS